MPVKNVQFRIRDILAVLLLSSLVLLWATEWSANNITAKDLLNAKQLSKTVLRPISSIDSRPATDEELARFLGLREWTEFPEWTGSPFSFSRGMDLSISPAWLDTEITYYWETKLTPTASEGTFSVNWNANWQAVEDRATYEKYLRNFQYALTVAMTITAVWLLFGKHRKVQSLRNSQTNRLEPELELDGTKSRTLDASQ